MKNSWIHWIYKGKWLLEDTNEENHIHISFLRERNICFLKSTKPREIANMIRHSWNMKSFEELRAQVTVYLEIFQMTLPYACKQCKRGFRHYLKSMGWGSLISSHIGSVRYTKEARLVSTTQQYRCVHCDLKEILKKKSVLITKQLIIFSNADNSTTLTPPGSLGVSREAKLSTEFEFGSLVR